VKKNVHVPRACISLTLEEGNPMKALLQRVAAEAPAQRLLAQAIVSAPEGV
jgi:hypothetical protein